MDINQRPALVLLRERPYANDIKILRELFSAFNIPHIQFSDFNEIKNFERSSWHMMIMEHFINQTNTLDLLSERLKDNSPPCFLLTSKELDQDEEDIVLTHRINILSRPLTINTIYQRLNSILE